VIFSNTVVASGTGIQVRGAEGAPYRQRVVANVVAAGIPLRGGEAAHNITQAYRLDWMNVAVSELTSRLLAHSQLPRRLPEKLVHELSAYPDWQGTVYPGARVTPSLLRNLGALQP